MCGGGGSPVGAPGRLHPGWKSLAREEGCKLRCPVLLGWGRRLVCPRDQGARFPESCGPGILCSRAAKSPLRKERTRLCGHCGFAFDTCAGSTKAEHFSLPRTYPGEETVFPNNSLPGPQSCSPLGNMRDILGSKSFGVFFILFCFFVFSFLGFFFFFYKV